MPVQLPGQLFLIIAVHALVFIVPALLGLLVSNRCNRRTARWIALGFRAVGLPLTIAMAIGAIYQNIWVFDYADDWRVIVGTIVYTHIAYIAG